jgi:hypothetical protein
MTQKAPFFLPIFFFHEIALETLAPATQALRRQEVMRELPALRERVLRSLAR